MDHRVHKPGLALSIVCAILAAITFIFLNQAFEGPSVTGVVGREPYHLVSEFKDAEALPTKQPVLVHGVQVGKVTDITFEKDSSTALVTFTIEDEFRPIHNDAKAVVGERTLLGDPYINLDPGTQGAPELPSGGDVRGLPSVDFDEALDFLDKDGREHVSSILDTLDHATRTDGSGGRLNTTVGELSRAVHNLRRLTDALHGQEDDIAGLVRDGSVVLSELGTREQSVRDIVASGRIALDALASDTASLKQGVHELPGVLDSSLAVLNASRPLARDARPIIRALQKAAPDLSAVLADIGPLAGDTLKTLSGLSGAPSLRKLLELVNVIGPVVPKLVPSAENLVTALQYMAPRTKGVASFFANMASVTAHGDSTARWARFAILFEPGEMADHPTPSVCRPEDDLPVNAGFCHNAYPFPGDAANPEPYEPGSYPRLQAFRPPPP